MTFTTMSQHNLSTSSSMPPTADLVLQTEAVYYWDIAVDILSKLVRVAQVEHDVNSKRVSPAYATVPVKDIPEKKATLRRRFRTALIALEGEITKIDPEMRSASSKAVSPLKPSSVAIQSSSSPLSIALAWRWGSKLLELEAAALDEGDLSPAAVSFLRHRDNWSQVTVLAALRYQYQSVLLELLPLEKEIQKATPPSPSTPSPNHNISDNVTVNTTSSAVIEMLKDNTKDALLGVLDCCRNALSLKGIGSVEQSISNSGTKKKRDQQQDESSDYTLTNEEQFAINFFEMEVAAVGSRYQIFQKQQPADVECDGVVDEATETPAEKKEESVVVPVAIPERDRTGECVVM